VCDNIVVTINDPDENLDCDQPDYVPFFVIINPGSWDPEQTHSATNFCELKMWGGTLPDGTPYENFVQWWNIYNPERYIDYPDTWFNQGENVLLAVFFAYETDVSSGVFEYNFGNIGDFMQALGLDDPDVDPLDRFTPGTTIAFYYLDPNDFDDFTLATAVVGDRPHSETYLTDANGVPVTEVKIGACCCDSVVVHLCDPHNEDDSEYWVIDEVGPNSGIFASLSGMPLLPVWDAVGGYQLVFDSWTFEAFNEDTIYARYNSVDYDQADLNLLGDSDPGTGFPPGINEAAARNQVWDVSFDLVKVYDTQVFDVPMPTSRGCGESYVTTGEHKMRFVTCAGTPITGEVPLGGEIGLEVTDLDQNENPLLRELVFGGWNQDHEGGKDATEDSKPIWEQAGGDSDLMTPQGATTPAPFLGRLSDDDDSSISGIPETVKVFMSPPASWWRTPRTPVTGTWVPGLVTPSWRSTRTPPTTPTSPSSRSR